MLVLGGGKLARMSFALWVDLGLLALLSRALSLPQSPAVDIEVEDGKSPAKKPDQADRQESP